MIIKEDVAQYIPLRWELLHPNLYEVALKAVASSVAEIACVEELNDPYGNIRNKFYWRRLVDHPQLELGL